MKTKLYGIDGKSGKEIEVPSFFSVRVREDILSKVLEAKKKVQAYGASPVAGRQHSASGILRHKRHSWKSSRGRGISRVPRKILWRRGTQFNWVGAEVSSAVGGRKAHAPKAMANRGVKNTNKKEERIAFISALAATANEKLLTKRYVTLNDKKIRSLPFVVEDKFSELKTKQFKEALKNILGEIYSVGEKKRTIRSGRGKMRGRKYKTNAGLLFVVGEKEKKKITGVEIQTANKLGVNDLAKGAPGRLVVYTERAIKDLEKRLDTNKGNKK